MRLVVLLLVFKFLLGIVGSLFALVYCFCLLVFLHVVECPLLLLAVEGFSICLRLLGNAVAVLVLLYAGACSSGCVLAFVLFEGRSVLVEPVGSAFVLLFLLLFCS